MTSDLHQVPGDIHPIELIHQKEYKEWCHLLGPDFVVQLPEIERGGGRGTFFIHKMADYHHLQSRLSKNRWRSTKLESVSIHRFLDGIPASMVVCVTRHGTLASALQRQLLDLACCGNFAEDGVFCGHAWGASPWPEAAHKSAFEQAVRIGDFLGTLGYKGLLGIDFIVQKTEGKAWPIEINPRLTGALPMLSLLHLQSGIVPMEVFHMLEFLEVPYRMDREALNKHYAETIQGSHLLVFRPQGSKNKVNVQLKPGLYEYDPLKGRGRFLKETLEYGRIQNRNQFILTDGPRFTPGSDSHSRLCRLLFSYPVMDIRGVLFPKARLAAEWVREEAMKSETP